MYGTRVQQQVIGNIHDHLSSRPLLQLHPHCRRDVWLSHLRLLKKPDQILLSLLPKLLPQPISMCGQQAVECAHVLQVRPRGLQCSWPCCTVNSNVASWLLQFLSLNTGWKVDLDVVGINNTFHTTVQLHKLACLALPLSLPLCFWVTMLECRLPLHDKKIEIWMQHRQTVSPNFLLMASWLINYSSFWLDWE